MFLVIDGHSESSIDLSAVPHRGEIISNADPKKPVYLVHRVEHFPSDSVNLHVQKFPNKIAAINAIDGFRNKRGWC